MKALKIIGLLLGVVATSAHPATLLVRWEDPTPAEDAYAPEYSVTIFVDGTEVETVTGLTDPHLLKENLAATASQTVQVQYWAVNVKEPELKVAGEKSALYTASALPTPGQQLPKSTVIVY